MAGARAPAVFFGAWRVAASPRGEELLGDTSQSLRGGRHRITELPLDGATSIYEAALVPSSPRISIHEFVALRFLRAAKQDARCNRVMLKTIYVPFTSRSKRGLPLSGSKFGSIFSQPGEREYGILSRGSSWSSAFSGSPTSR